MHQDFEQEIAYLRVKQEEVSAYESAGFVRCGVLEQENGQSFLPMAKSFALDHVPWIAFGSDHEAILYRNDFCVCEAFERVTLQILTHGFMEVYLNGKRIADDLYVPAWTNYNAQDFSKLHYPLHDTFCHRSYYLEYDLTFTS